MNENGVAKNGSHSQGMNCHFKKKEVIKHRTDSVVELALTQVDDKANWLAAHLVGSNYDITVYDYILPIAVSPFVEFIPSQDTRY